MSTGGGDAKLFARVRQQSNRTIYQGASPVIGPLCVQCCRCPRVCPLRITLEPHSIIEACTYIKMFIPHIPVVSSSLTPPGSLYPRSRQGKVAELRTELNSGGKRDKNHSAKKIALKKIVANMTMSNNDMVALFPDIVNCMQIPSLEVKKM